MRHTLRFVKTVVAGVILTTACGLWAQTAPNVSGSALPEDIIYMHVFMHVAKYQEIATAAAAAGNTSSPFLHSFRTKLGLNPNEEQDLNVVALNCKNQILAVQQAISVIVKQFRAKY